MSPRTSAGSTSAQWRLRRVLSVAGAGCAAALSVALLFTLGNIDSVPVFLPWALLGLTAITVWRDDVGLLILATIVPVASWVGRGWNYYVAWAEALVIAVAAGWFIRAIVRGPRERDDLDGPVQLVSAIVFASIVVYSAVSNWRLSGNPFGLPFGEMVQHYFVIRGQGDVVDAGMRLLESMFLFRAASVAARASPAFTPWLARCLVTGATVAGTLNLWRLWEAAQRVSPPLVTFLRYLASVRLNVHYADLNAAGSYFVMVLFVAVGIALLPRHRKWIPAALIICAALWVTGSRAAFVAGMLAAILMPLSRRLRQVDARHARIGLAVTALVLVCTAATAAYYLPQRTSQSSSLDALRIRWELAKASLRMTASHPVFGVGVGQYYHLSGEFSSPELLRLFPPARNENAHNNFLQILAEFGIFGFAAFLWLLLVTATHVRAGLTARDRDPLRWGIAVGVGAFLLTCLGGHPLLIDEPAFAFWLTLGTAAGWQKTRPRATALSRTTTFSLAAVLIVLILIPVRARQQMAEADMEHMGFGLSLWQSDPDGVRYRYSSGQSTVFLPADARLVSIPLRVVEKHRTLQVGLRLDGRPADVVVVPADRWYDLRLPLPPDASRSRFRRLDLDVSDAHPTGTNILMVGKVVPH
jgi:O-antigen ligase